jgi:MFS family permease
MAMAMMAFGVACTALGSSPWLWLSMTLMTVTGYGLMYQVVATNTIVQTIVDDDKRGRVMSFYTIALAGSGPIGSLLSGSLAEAIGVQGTYAVSGGSCLLMALWFWRQLPAIRAAVRPRYMELGIITDR